MAMPDLKMNGTHDDERRRYELCRMGFVLLSIALVMACFTALIALPTIFLNGQVIFPWIQNPVVWFWIETPIVFGSLMGSYCLWGRWDEPSWQRRTGLLVLMCMVDALLWFIRHGNDLGLKFDDFGHQWLRMNIGEALGWAEFALLASLACEMMTHLGVTQAEEAGRSTRSLAATGASLFMVLFCLKTDWQRGWPLEYRPVFSIALRLLSLGELMVQTITLIQVTALVVAATRQTGALLQDMSRQESDDDPWQSPPV